MIDRLQMSDTVEATWTITYDGFAPSRFDSERGTVFVNPWRDESGNWFAIVQLASSDRLAHVYEPLLERLTVVREWQEDWPERGLPRRFRDDETYERGSE